MGYDVSPSRGPNSDLIGKAGSRHRLSTPALLLDLDIMEENIQRMAEFCTKNKISLRPHAKAHKSIRISKLQIDAGAIGICCATLGEAEILADGGVSGVLITSPVVGDRKIERLVALNKRCEGVLVVTDHPDNPTPHWHQGWIGSAQ